MAKNLYTMNRKDFRILPRNRELDANADYVAISNSDAEAVMKGEKSGLRILKEQLIRLKEDEMVEAANQLNLTPVRAEETSEETDEEPEIDPEVLREDDTLPPAYATMRARDLDAIAVSRGITFPAGMRKGDKIDILSKE